MSSESFSQELAHPDVGGYLAAGEFSSAKGHGLGLPVDQRDFVLAQVAGAQGSVGESSAANGTIRGIESSLSRDDAIAGAGGAGGGSFADFQSLMDLIQTTIVPDTWEALGGPSSMSPYPQGVYVDPAGTVLECESLPVDDGLAELKALLGDAVGKQETELAWRQPANMRCVSLRRLLDAWTAGRIQGAMPSESMMQMAGLSRIQYLFIDEHDIVLAGPVGGIETRRGWHVDRVSGLSTLRFDFFLACLASATGNQPFGCTIDPTTEGLQNAAKVAAAVQSDKLPIGKADAAMVAALGMQRVEVFGTAGDTPMGCLMVEADRHMKQLALGLEPMPEGARNYFDVVEENLEAGVPNDLLLRLWFTSAPRPVRADAERTVFELAGTPVRLSGQNERAMASGRRGNVTRDPRSEEFVEDFNRNWHAIRGAYPISAAELMHRYADSTRQRALLESLISSSPSSMFQMRNPRQVMSIAVMNSMRKGRRTHHVLLASGGVSVNAKQTLVSKIADYPSLSSMNRPANNPPKLIHKWWWNVGR
ncbi:MAG: DUF1598 domain-containing protein [Rubripirellula sp.]